MNYQKNKIIIAEDVFLYFKCGVQLYNKLIWGKPKILI
jgi:hypothetical protein